MTSNWHLVWEFTLFLVVAEEREKKGKEEGKGKKKKSERENIFLSCVDKGKKGMKKM